MDEKGENMYIWTHKKFEIGYNGKQVTHFLDAVIAFLWHILHTRSNAF